MQRDREAMDGVGVAIRTSVERTRRQRLWLTLLSALLLGGGASGAGSPAPAAWLELRPPRGARLLVDLERPALWLADRCDLPYAIDGLERMPEGFRARASSEQVFDLPAGPVRASPSCPPRGSRARAACSTSASASTPCID